ncbi:MAG: N-acetylmuramoyl-L-alanine amidase [Methylobacterium sp.]|nr:N-acetylmuramoyl-L-alanine amidase [Methylobacterium sp.]MCA3598965.1 N-acetylmuramoyl-L-alanine amidase [Methylobacterium sp.]MCA3599849.1 N-acetylmuramoyl-L-alanine amidase [Methylobacterium sp.]MCA3604356.1 N-acetylmuramoyl-L-alanine amidase [Methylobacterium sp.]MCA3609005.1 N-acetylmuramoyl-L-alanine amidase [Methylobacterium sp.]
MRLSSPRRGAGAALLAGLAVFVLALFPASVAEAQGPQGAPVVIRAIHPVEGQSPDLFAIIIDLSEETTFRHEVLAGPDRLVIDLDRSFVAASAQRMTGRPLPAIGALRAGLFMAGQSRIVIDLARPVLIERADFVRQAGVARLVVQLRVTSVEAFQAQARLDSARRMTSRTARPEPPPDDRGDTRPLVVIDPGHGGIDPGASGARGETEKDIVLAIGLALRDRLVKSGRVRVAMTREDDRFISLGERVKFARARDAKLFVSLHADSLAGEPDVRGASVYTLSDRATDALAARAAEKENRADLIAGLDADEEAKGGIEPILVDLARRETRAFAQLAARQTVTALGNRTHKTPLRGAGFRVLRATDMPSILIELGYLSNPLDLRALADGDDQKSLAETLAHALEAFVLATSIPESAGVAPTPAP